MVCLSTEEPSMQPGKEGFSECAVCADQVEQKRALSRWLFRLRYVLHWGFDGAIPLEIQDAFDAIDTKEQLLDWLKTSPESINRHGFPKDKSQAQELVNLFGLCNTQNPQT
jgi:hypothetical protein